MLQPTRLISTPFAQEGEKTEIQNVTGEFDNSATYRLGFPPLTMQSIRLGGKPPKGTDFNGVLFDITENISFLCKGGRYQYNAGLSTLIGGYPEGSNLLLDDNVTEVVSTVAGNQNNPNTDMTGWILKPNKTTAENVTDGNQTQKEINSANSLKSVPEFFGAVGDGVTVDNAAFSALAASKPKKIECDPSATYLIDSSSTVLFTEDCIINGNGATIIMDQRWNLQKQAMWSTYLSADVTKGSKVLPVLFTTQFQVGQKVLIFQNKGLSGADIDPYFLTVSDDVDNGEYSSHINYISAVDHANKTITLAIPLLYNAPQQTTVNILTDKKLTFVNTNFVFSGVDAGFRIFDNCDNIEFIGGSIKQDSSQNNNVNLRVNTCHNVNFTDVDIYDANISIEYGSFNCGVKYSRGVSKGNGDAILMIWCAATRCFSEHNDFRASNDMKLDSITAGVYLGAKTRDCWSTDDNVDGLPYGFRAQWGAVNPSFTRATAQNVGIYSLFSDYTHNLQITDSKLYDKPLRTVSVHRLTLKDTLLDSRWRGEAGEIPLMLDLNRGSDTSVVREDYTISGNTVIGSARAWLALSKSTFTNNNMTTLRFVNAGIMKDTYFNGNTLGHFYSQNIINCGFTNNTVDYSQLLNGTVAGAEVAGVGLYGLVVLNMSGNTIKHPTCGVKRTTPNVQVNCILDGGGNNVISPTQWDTGVNDATAPTIGSSAAYLSRGLEYKSNIAGSNVVWRYNGTSWVRGFSKYPQVSYAQASFPNTPNGLTTFGTTRTITGAVVGDTVIVSTTSTDIGEVKGKFFARVTTADTITVYYQDKSGVSETVAGVSITLTLVKS